MPDLPFALFEGELLALFNSFRGVHLEGSRFRRAVRPIMVERGEARCNRDDGNRRATWVYNAHNLWQWEQYLVVRGELIRRGVWAENHAYSAADLDGVAHLEMHDAVTEELFPTQAGAGEGGEDGAP